MKNYLTLSLIGSSYWISLFFQLMNYDWPMCRSNRSLYVCVCVGGEWEYKLFRLACQLLRIHVFHLKVLWFSANWQKFWTRKERKKGRKWKTKLLIIYGGLRFLWQILFLKFQNNIRKCRKRSDDEESGSPRRSGLRGNLLLPLILCFQSYCRSSKRGSARGLE